MLAFKTLTNNIRKVFLTLFLFAIFVSVIVCAAYYKIGYSLPNPEFLKEYSSPEISRVYDKHYNLIHEYSPIKRINIPFEKIPQKLISAFLVAEDKNFYHHKGLDPFRIFKAISQNMWHKNSRKNLIGASTITQQVAKNFVVGNEKSIVRKIKEAFVTFKIEYSLSKDRIIELYLNQIYLGNSCFGIQAAALSFFGKSVEQLLLEEICLLAALPKAPTYLTDGKNIERLKKRRDIIINYLLEQGYITKNEAMHALNTDIQFSNTKSTHNDSYGYYLTPLKEQLENDLCNATLTQGLEIVSCMDISCQKAAQKALRDGLVNFEEKRGVFYHPIASLGENYSLDQLKNLEIGYISSNAKKAIAHQKKEQWFVTTEDKQTFLLDCKNWHLQTPLKNGDVVLVKIKNKKAYLTQTPKVSGSIVVMEAKTGKVLAIAGGLDFKKTPFNCATQALRQPGSSFKPFAYLTALENGTKAGDIIMDEKMSIKMDNSTTYIPKNVDGKFHGAVTVKTSLAHSYNIAAINLAIATGIDRVTDTAELFGIYNNAKQHLSIVLGAQETTLLKLTTAYAMIFNGGNYLKPKFYKAYTKRNLNISDTLNAASCSVDQLTAVNLKDVGIIKTSQKIASSKAIFSLLEMLRSVITSGTGRKLLPLERKYGITIHGKTGTSNNNLDAWFVGSVSIPGTVYQADNPLVIGVFVGYLKPESLGKGNGGAAVALPIFSNFLENFISDSL